MKANKLTGQAAINFAQANDVCLYGRDFIGQNIGSRPLLDDEAQEMVNEGIEEGVWCWTDCTLEPEDFDEPRHLYAVVDDENDFYGFQLATVSRAERISADAAHRIRYVLKNVPKLPSRAFTLWS